MSTWILKGLTNIFRENMLIWWKYLTCTRAPLIWPSNHTYHLFNHFPLRWLINSFTTHAGWIPLKSPPDVKVDFPSHPSCYQYQTSISSLYMISVFHLVKKQRHMLMVNTESDDLCSYYVKILLLLLNIYIAPSYTVLYIHKRCTLHVLTL